MDTLATQDFDDVCEVVLVVAVDAFHARIIVRDTMAGEHLHAFPLEFLLCIDRFDLLHETIERLPDPCALQCLDAPDKRDVCQEILVECAGAIWADNLVVAHQDDREVGGIVRDRPRDLVDDVGIDRRHGRVDNLDSFRGQSSPELGSKESVNPMVVEGEAHRRGPPEDVDSNQLRTALFGKRVLQGTNVQRRRKELVGEIRIFLVVRYAIDVNLVEVVERCSDTRNREPQLQQSEEEQRDQDGRNEYVDNFLNGIAPVFSAFREGP